MTYILYLYWHQVSKKQVDNYKEGKVTPCCQLLAEVFSKKKEVPVFKRQVNLKGAKYPNDVFVISLPIRGRLISYITREKLKAQTRQHFMCGPINFADSYNNSPLKPHTFGDIPVLPAQGIAIAV